MRYCLLLVFLLAGCQSSLAVLEGSSHACGTLHVEGYWTDTQGDIIVAKAPADWTADQVIQLCNGIE